MSKEWIYLSVLLSIDLELNVFAEKCPRSRRNIFRVSDLDDLRSCSLKSCRKSCLNWKVERDVSALGRGPWMTDWLTDWSDESFRLKTKICWTFRSTHRSLMEKPMYHNLDERRARFNQSFPRGIHATIRRCSFFFYRERSYTEFVIVDLGMKLSLNPEMVVSLRKRHGKIRS